MTDHLTYVVLWLSFGVVHSLLTLPKVKVLLAPAFGRFYRISYNLLSAIHILIVLAVGKSHLSQAEFALFSSQLSHRVTLIVQIVGVVIIALALRQYNLGLFSGLSQLRPDKNQPTADGLQAGSQLTGYINEEYEPLNISGLNRWVRHPIYTGAFILLWGGATTEYGLATAFYASLYLIIGSHFEERKLAGMYGDKYLAYQRDVPKFIPLLKNNTPG